MITIEETASVDDTHKAVVTFYTPASVKPGKYRVVLVVDSSPLVEAEASDLSIGNDPVAKLIGAYSGPKGATGRNAEEILYGNGTGISPYGPRKEGLHPGAWEVAEDFDDPFPDEFWLGGNP